MHHIKLLFATTTALAAVMGGVQASDLPLKKAAPIEYVRICTTYGAGFFYIPGTDTCIRLSGRARFQSGYQTTYSRNGTGGDTTGYQTRMRINLDARTQTGYGTLRAFLRLDTGSSAGGPYAGGRSNTQERLGNAFAALGVDAYGRAQQFVNADKAFVQFAGFTAGRASSFYDFYAHDFEFTAATAGSDLGSTNLLAYTATNGGGLSATLSVEDPTFRRTPIFSPYSVSPTVTNGSVFAYGITYQPIPVIDGYIGSNPSRFTSIDGIERSRMPDFVGALRYDAKWGSAQISSSVHQLNVGNVANATVTTAGAAITGITPGSPTGGAGSVLAVRHTNSDYGYAVQGGIKLNLPFISAGDTFYLQSSYGVGAQSYTGYSSYSGSATQSAALIQGQKFAQYFADATINPFTGQLQKSDSFSIVGAYLHYWTPELRSAAYASYGEQNFSASARLGQGVIFNLVNSITAQPFGNNAVGTPGTRFYTISQALRDTYQIVAGGSLIWSPVKDLDIGVDGFYTQIGLQRGRAIDLDKDSTAYSAARVASINAGGVVRTATQTSVSQIRLRIQRDF